MTTTFGPGPLSKVAFWLLGGATLASMAQAVSRGDFLQNFAINAFALLLISILGFIVQQFSRTGQQRQQRLRDQRASEILTGLRTGQPPLLVAGFGSLIGDGTYSLYLRGFATTGKMPQNIGLQDRGAGGEQDLLDLEAILAQALESSAPLVALGQPGEQIGAGRVHSDDDHWQENLALLADGAQYVFILPTDTPGTIWEIGFILRTKLLKKCFFLMPPWKENGDKDQWKRLRARMESLIHLPRYKHLGMIFTIREDGTMERSKAFGRGTKEIKRSVHKILAGETDELDGDQSLSDPSDIAPLDEVDEEAELHCPNCDAPYRLSDYRPDAAVISCTSCGEELPKVSPQNSRN